MVPLPHPISHTVAAIYAAYEADADTWESAGLSISWLGAECDRQLWYAYRWAVEPKRADGRTLRLFDTGEREEVRLLDDLRRIGCQVEARDERGRQRRVSAARGHLRGKLDGQALGIPEASATWHVVECKSHNAKSFRALAKQGVKKAEPGHYVQCQIYMHLTGMDRTLYLAACKDNDELYAERLRYEPQLAAWTVASADRIIRAAEPPPRLHDDPSAKMAFACGWCPALEACHGGGWARRHCRTCLHSTPVDGGGWNCGRHGRPLTYADQQRGCQHHLYILALVPGQQVDVDEVAETVTYRLRDGSQWIDGEREGNSHGKS